MNPGKTRPISLAIAIIALAAALCLTQLVSFLPYQPSSSASLRRDTLSPNASSKTLYPAQPFSELRRRVESSPLEPMSDGTWNKKVSKGKGINCLFERPIELVPQSKFTKWQDLSDWGWEFKEDTSFFIKNKLGSGAMLYLDTFFEKYPLPTKPWETKGLRIYNMDHTKPYKRPGSIEEHKVGELCLRAVTKRS